MGRPSRKEREKDRMRREILEAAEAVFSTHGFHNTTISMIAAAAGLSVGSIYNFFPGKEALFYSIIEKSASEGLEALREAADAIDSPVEKLRTVITQKVNYFIAHYDFFKIFIGVTSASYRPQIERDNPVLIQYHDYIDWLEATFRWAMEQGCVKPCDPRLLAISLEGLTDGLIEHWEWLKDTSDIQKLVGNIVDVFLRGILTER
ncbi:TetR/AcrR family transcriptional regulator [bacterium]|nr:TetR/AcrR family transcriptional regulator [bacterium]